MARKIERKPQRDDWVQVEEIELTDGSGRMGVMWQNLITTERVTLRKDVHPLDNQNAITKISDAIQAVAETQTDDEPLEETPEDRVVALFAEARSSEGRAQVIVSRIENDGTRTHCRKYDPAEFENDNFDLVRQEFGPGNYWFLLYATNPESGKFVRRSGIKLKLAPLPASIANTQANGQQSEIVRLLDRMDQRLAQVEKAPAPIDPMAQMNQFATVFKMISDMMPKPAAAPDPMAAVKQLTEMLGVAKTIREEIDPKPDTSDPLLALAGPAIDLVKTAITQQRGGGNGLMPSVAMPPQIAAAEISPNPVAQPVTRPNDVIETAESRAIEEMNELIATFNTLAKISASVESAAEIAYDKLPDDVLEALLRDPQWWTLLSEAFPSVLPYRAWYESVRSELIKLESEPEDDHPAPPAEGKAAGVHST